MTWQDRGQMDGALLGGPLAGSTRAPGLPVPLAEW
jgi:hypothetical protein